MMDSLLGNAKKMRVFDFALEKTCTREHLESEKVGFVSE